MSKRGYGMQRLETGNFWYVHNLLTKWGIKSVIEYEKATILQFDNSIIAVKTGDKTYLTDKWNHSPTIAFYRRAFLGEAIDKTRQKLESGEYGKIDQDLNIIA